MNDTGRAPQRWAGGFLFDPVDQAVLLHLRDGNTTFNPNKWALFGGLCHAGEGPDRCFRRELREEIGLELPANQVVLLREQFVARMATHRYVFFVPIAVRTSDLVLGEGAGFAWIPLAELNGLNLSDLSREDLEIFVAKLSAA